MDKQEALKRLDAIERRAQGLRDISQALEAEAKALRAIIEANGAALDKYITPAETLEKIARDIFEKAKAMREAEPKKEPRGLCWVSDRNANPGPDDSVAMVALTSASGLHFTRNQSHWVYAIPLTESEMQEHRGRWE